MCTDNTTHLCGALQVTFVTGGREQALSVWDLRVPSPVRTLAQAHER